MHDFYYEMTIESPSCGFIKSFLDELQIPYEEKNQDKLIIRDENSLDEIQSVVELFIETTSKKINKSLDVKINTLKLKNEDWIKKYQEGISAIEIDEFYIRASWHEASNKLINIVIDPALAFGSGHHESTNSCLKCISKYTKPNDTLLDVGSGSGILGIAANKKGAIVDICDTDDLAIFLATQNFKLNSAKINKSWIGSANSTNDKYKIVVVNIIADVILMIKKELISKLNTNSTLILSGILENYKLRILESFNELTLVEQIQQNEWCTFVFQNKK